jgi:hypothetical protein
MQEFRLVPLVLADHAPAAESHKYSNADLDLAIAGCHCWLASSAKLTNIQFTLLLVWIAFDRTTFIVMFAVFRSDHISSQWYSNTAGQASSGTRSVKKSGRSAQNPAPDPLISPPQS